MEQLTVTFKNFWTVVQSVWNQGVLGQSLSQAMIGFLIFLVFFVFRGLFRRFVITVIERWTKKSTNSFDDELSQALAGPLQVLFIALGLFFAFQYVGFKGEMETLADNIVRTVITVAIFWALYNMIKPLSGLLRRLQGVLTAEMLTWLITGIRWGVLFLGGATILQLWGIQVGPILAGLGLFGVAVALGAQDLFRNLIGGLCVLIEKRFKVGDWVMVDGVVEGTVEHIGFRSTEVRRFDQAPVFVPNQKLSDNAVTNFSRMTYRRIYWKIGLEYKISLEQLKAIREKIETYLQTNEVFVQPPAASMFVRVDAFNASSIDLMLYTFTHTTVWGDWLAHKETLAYEVKQIVEGEGASFAFPSQSIYIEKHPEGTPEPFVPPASKG
uniref:mechanosensitive ion channel family protein n=1 Tax=Orrella sp. TaxID=1921583 RepID=UPI0040478142